LTLTLLAAVARNGTIGRDGRLPWHLPEDLQHFKRLTLGHPIIMGRRTFDSIGRPLPDRRTIVVTRNRSWHTDGVETAGSLAAALALTADERNVFVVGGRALFEEALPLADVVELTEIDADVEGDTFFPVWDRSLFVETFRETHRGPRGERFAFVTYRRASKP
jgi:dihydrofolate reductase